MKKVPKNPRANIVYRRELLLAAAEDDDFKNAVWQRCSNDPVFFIDAFAWTYSPKEYDSAPNRPFVLWDYQEQAVHKINDAIGKNDLLIEKSRDMGASWLCLTVFMWRWMFFERQSFLMGSRKQELVDKSGDPKSLFWKALTLDTPVLTPSGFVRNGDLSIGDSVIGRSGKPVPVTAIYDHGVKPVYRVRFNDGTSVRCCGDHLWTVSHATGLHQSWLHGKPVEYGAVRTEDMAANFKSSTAKKKTKNLYRVPVGSAVEMAPSGGIPVKPYLMGALIGDGSLSSSSVSICGVDEEVLSRAASEVPSGSEMKHSTGISYLITGSNGIANKAIKEAGLRYKRSWEKFIPEPYLTASVDDRIDLMRGLMDTDGTVSLRAGARGERSDTFYFTSSKQLADDFVRLVRSIGGFAHEPRAYKKGYKKNGTYHPCRDSYHVNFVSPVNPFFLKRKADKWRYRPIRDKIITDISLDGEDSVRCITVDSPDHLYVVDGYTLTHNCDYIIDNLPGWMIPRHSRTSMHFHNEENGSTIDGESTNDDFARGDRRTAILLDEFPAVIDNGHNILAATRDATNCRIFNGTPQGSSGAYYDTRQVIATKYPDRLLRMHWTMHPLKKRGLYGTHGNLPNAQRVIHDKSYRFSPDYNFIPDGKLRSPWYDEQCLRAAHPQEIAQELDIDYAASGWQFFDPKVLSDLVREMSRPPVYVGELSYERKGEESRFDILPGGRFKLWCNLSGYGEPEKAEYVVGCDIATGKGGEMSSNSVASVANRKTGQKVAQFTGNTIEPYEFATYAQAICKLFKNREGEPALLIWEENGPGMQFSRRIRDDGFRHVFMRESETDFYRKKTQKAGWYSNKDTKRNLLTDYQEALTSRLFWNPCEEAIKECGDYIHLPDGTIEHSRARGNINPTAAGESHGDMVIADALVVRGIKDRGGVQSEKADESTLICPPGSYAFRRREWERAQKKTYRY